MDDLNLYVVYGLERRAMYEQMYGNGGPSSPFEVMTRAPNPEAAASYARGRIAQSTGNMATVSRILEVPRGDYDELILESSGHMGQIDWDAPWYTQKIVALDVETTGLDLDTDRITEVGYSTYNPETKSFGAAKDFLVNEGKEIPQSLIEKGLNDITNQTIADEPPFSEFAEQVVDDFSGAIVMAQNRGFDYCFVQRALNRTQHVNFTLGPAVCSAEVAIYLDDNSQVDMPYRKNMQALAEHFGVEYGRGHRAGDDALACGNTFMAMVRAAVSAGHDYFMNWTTREFVRFFDTYSWPKDDPIQ